ncbi:hypothetical protein CYMTET_56905 [Cymbomonas tetramitiformis]|uniref:Uncharacterized protein n=1 Tax=Cymbomonas tetramitiformis TaxID=36881 RepID=A0AAE0BB94_9CHLO|nr:hypothetical protein CYMTET_56905 [Cymbomonas tetramitiformis]
MVLGSRRQFAEGSSYNKALQIYNPGPSTVFLEEVQLLVASNGGTFLTAISNLALEGTELLAESVFTVMHPEVAASWLEHANVTSQALLFNGDDAVAVAVAHKNGSLEVLDRV